jgi:predicted TIM-barrel fold metal-dependent hydrolase
MARLPFVDTHVHFYDLRDSQSTYALLGRRLRLTRFQNLEGLVHVQAALGSEDPVEETRWLQAFHDRIGVPDGAIGYEPRLAVQISRHSKRLCANSGCRETR